MRTLVDFAFRHEYVKVKKRGDKLSEIATLIDWDAFRPILSDLYNNKSTKGGRPNIDVVIMVKLLVLQQMYGLSDPALEREVADRISFRIFLGTTEIIPDFTTVWLFRERLINSGKDKAIWEEFQRQLDAMGLKIKKGIIQDASFITSDPGHASKDTPRGDEAKTRRSKDGTWAKKGQESFFGYKAHIGIDIEYHMIRFFETTTASLHDSQVDLGVVGLPRYGDKGYFGAKTRGYDASMKRATRGHQLSLFDTRRNERISRKRSPIERCFAVMKIVFKAGHVMVTTIKRVGIKVMFNAFGYNLYNLLSIARKSA